MSRISLLGAETENGLDSLGTGSHGPLETCLGKLCRRAAGRMVLLLLVTDSGTRPYRPSYDDEPISRIVQSKRPIAVPPKASDIYRKGKSFNVPCARSSGFPRARRYLKLLVLGHSSKEVAMRRSPMLAHASRLSSLPRFGTLMTSLWIKHLFPGSLASNGIPESFAYEGPFVQGQLSIRSPSSCPGNEHQSDLPLVLYVLLAFSDACRTVSVP
jgi:hypothetical protein